LNRGGTSAPRSENAEKAGGGPEARGETSEYPGGAAMTSLPGAIPRFRIATPRFRITPQ